MKIRFCRFGGMGFGFLAFCLVTGDLRTESYSVLHNFGDGPGSFAGVNLVTDGAVLYGMTTDYVFKLNRDGTGFTALRAYHSNDTSPAQGGLTLADST